MLYTLRSLYLTLKEQISKAYKPDAEDFTEDRSLYQSVKTLVFCASLLTKLVVLPLR